MMQKDFAALVGTTPSTVCLWKQKGYLVMTDGGIDVEASKARLIEKRGTTGPLSARERSQLSGWSKGPHCKTASAFNSFRRLRDDQ